MDGINNINLLGTCAVITNEEILWVSLFYKLIKIRYFYKQFTIVNLDAHNDHKKLSAYLLLVFGNLNMIVCTIFILFNQTCFRNKLPEKSKIRKCPGSTQLAD